ncbi:MAG: TetR/AcrR family transcriptional regulator [Bacteroidetes bacterium]|nr:TetR/AcrR family transcriptional regulator [Bacteroidota bacterium]
MDSSDIHTEVGRLLNGPAYLKDPDSSETGRDILLFGAEMMACGGIESFTFRKLASRAGITEATVYRYFSNKHQLLLYLLNRYWNALEYKAMQETVHINEPLERLQRLAELLTGPVAQAGKDEFAGHLYAIAMSESVKVHLGTETGSDWQKGMLNGYARITGLVAETLRTANPDYPYPRAWAATFVDSAMQQQFLLRHLPELTEVQSAPTSLTRFLLSLIPQQESKEHASF